MFWDFSVAEVSGDELTNRLRTQYEQDRKAQRFYY
jgi:TPP-dependent trihydroxycyclohexane-1,2-dione (THcHDO) dehydratase